MVTSEHFIRRGVFPTQLASGWALTALTPAEIVAAVQRQLDDAGAALRRDGAPPVQSPEAALQTLLSLACG